MENRKEKSVRLMGMRVENFCKVILSNMAPMGKSVQISGKNRQGKTSNCNAMWVGMGGSDAMKELGITKPVHGDAESAKISLDLGDILVHRELTQDGQTKKLLVTTADGFKLEPGQTVLDTFRGKFYDLSQFYRMDSDKRLELVLSLLDLGGLDLKEWKAGRKAVFDERTLVNREHKALEAQLKAKPEVEAPDVEISVKEITEEMQQEQLKLDANNLLRQALQTRMQDRNVCKEKITVSEAAIVELQAKLDAENEKLDVLKKELAGINASGRELQEQVTAIVDPDMTGYSQRMADVEQINVRVRAKKERAELAEKVAAKQKESEDLTLKLDAYDFRKKKAIKEANFSVEGLGFDDTDITFNDMPFSQSSDMERLIVGYGIAKVLSPRFNILRLSRPGDLDPENLEHLYAMAAADDIQILTEMVNDGKSGNLIIEDGIMEGGTTEGVEKIIEAAKPKRAAKKGDDAAAEASPAASKKTGDAELDAIYEQMQAEGPKGGKAKATKADKTTKPVPAAVAEEL